MSLHFVFLKQRSKQEIRRGEQGFNLTFPPPKRRSELFSFAKMRPFESPRKTPVFIHFLQFTTEKKH
jgi:hypothetical protein